jgi:CRAL/TRIO domain
MTTVRSSIINTNTTCTTGTRTWPWLQPTTPEAYGAGAVAVPSPHSTHSSQYDSRESIHTMIQERQSMIRQMQMALQNDPLYIREKHDEIWLVRFLLSHQNNVSAAMEAARYTLAFRKEHHLDDVDLRYVTPDAVTNPSVQRYLAHVQANAIQFIVPNDIQRSTCCVVTYIDIGGIDLHGLVQNVPQEDWLPTFLYFNERAYQWLDYITRTTGRLTKVIRIIDASRLQISSVWKNLESFRRDGQVMKITQDCYPQLLQTMYICDAPSLLQVPWRVIRPLFPKRVTTKFDFITPKSNRSEYQRLVQHIAAEQLPLRFGGMN